MPVLSCNKKLVIYRRADNTPAVLEDACWHRLLPLSKGRLDGDNVVAAITAWSSMRADAVYRCLRQETLNPSACVRVFPAVERHRFIWVWMGDPVLADPANIPDMHWNDESGLGRRRSRDPPPSATIAW